METLHEFVTTYWFLIALVGALPLAGFLALVARRVLPDLFKESNDPASTHQDYRVDPAQDRANGLLWQMLGAVVLLVVTGLVLALIAWAP